MGIGFARPGRAFNAPGLIKAQISLRIRPLISLVKPEKSPSSKAFTSYQIHSLSRRIVGSPHPILILHFMNNQGKTFKDKILHHKFPLH